MKHYLSVAPTVLLSMKTHPLATLCLVLFVPTCTYFCWWYWKLNRAYAKFPSVRMEFRGMLKLMLGRYPKNVPFTSALFQEILKLIRQFEKEGFFVLWFFRPYFIIFREDIIKRLHAEPALYNKTSLYELFTEYFGNGLLTSNDDVWKSHRKILNPAFQTGSLKGKMRIFNKNAADLVAVLEKRVGQSSCDLSENVKQCSFNIMAESILGLNLKDETYKEKIVTYFQALEEMAHVLFSRIPRPWLYWKFSLPLFASGRKYLKVCKDLHCFTQQIVLEMKNPAMATVGTKKGTEWDVDDKTSFTRILLDQHLKDPSFTMKDVQDQITTIMAAGHDTTSTALLWCLYALGLHSDVQEKAFKEIQANVGTDVTYDDLSQIKYLESAIKETFRLYSIVPIYGRKLNKEIQWENYTIPNGTEIGFVPYFLHRSPDVYKDPMKFDPERFSETSNIRPWTYLPFAEGYRSCIGKKFAMMELKVILVHIIRRFKIETLEEINCTSDVDWAIIMKPLKPHRFLITLR